MTFADFLFSNFLGKDRVTATRLDNFSNDVILRLEKVNENGEYTDLIGKLTPLRNALHKEVGDIDITIAEQIGKTQDVNQLIDTFKSTMSDLEGFIAKTLGGYKSSEYLELYPRGVTEYTYATKTDIPTLMNRVTAKCAKFGNKLGTLATTLQAFENQWYMVRGEQEKVKGAVVTNRGEQSAARKAMETALLYTIHTIGAKFPDNEEICRSFFDFSLLYPAGTRHKNDDTQEEPTTDTTATASAETKNAVTQ